MSAAAPADVARPVDVALVVDTLGRGGAERVLVALANGLDRRRFRVHVIATRQPGELAADLAPDVAVHSLDRATRLDLGALRRFARLTTRLRIRIVHTHSHTAAYLARLARPLGAPWRHVVHDHHGPVEGSPALRLLDRLLLRGADHYFAVSERLARYGAAALALDDARCEHLRNGVDVPAVAPGPAADGPFTVVQVARLAPEKDQLTALAAAARLRALVPGSRWLLVGRDTGPYADRCRAEAARLGLGDAVAFVGERADVADVVRGAHAAVLTSRVEGLPVALLECMASGLPVVVTDAGDCAAVVQAAGGGAVVAPGDAAAIADALAALARDPAAAARDGAANHRLVAERYGAAAVARRVGEVYDALLAGRVVAAAAGSAAVGLREV